MAGIVLNRSRQAPAEETPAFGGIAERFRRAGDLDRAIALCRDGLKKFPDQLSARVTLGWALLDKGQYDDARAELERVLRKAPDNLAAIRGLAELHDRSEGAMPAEESWQHEEVAPETPAAAPAAAAATQTAPHAAPAPTAVAQTGKTAVKAAPQVHDDPFAPISVSLPASGVSAAPELMQTAEQAGRAAEEAAAESSLLGESVDQVKVEIEDPAAASMAAAGAVVEPVASEKIELADPMSLALEASDAEVEAELAKLTQAEPASFDAGDVSQFANLEADPKPAPAIELGESHSAQAASEPADTDEINDAIRALEMAAESGPTIDFGSAVDVLGATEPDPEADEAARALAAISLDEPIKGADVGTVVAASAAEPVIDFGVADVAVVEEAAAVPVAAPDPIVTKANRKKSNATQEATPLEPEAIAPAIIEPTSFAPVVVVSRPLPEPEPEPEPAGPVFELVAPEPIDLSVALEGTDEAEFELSPLGDDATADLFAMMAAEPEPEPLVEGPVLDAALPSVVESSDEAIAAELKALESRPAAADPVSDILMEEDDEAEHFVEVADSGPAWVPSPADVRPVLETAATNLVFNALAEIDRVPLSNGVVDIASAASRSRSRSQASVVALERLLKKVEARRLQLQSESVA